MKKIFFSLLIGFLFNSFYPASVNAVACNIYQDMTASNKNASLNTSCTIAIDAVDGVDKATGETDTRNTAKLTLVTGGAITINSGGTLAVGSLELSGGSISTLNGEIKIGTPIYAPDTDSDGIGVYTTLYAATASGRRRLSLMKSYTANDCATSDATKWQTISGYVDADGDGFGTGTSQNACSGATLASGYVANNTDCKDSGTGAANVNKSASCHLDLDNDTYTSAAAASTCTNNATCTSATYYVDAGNVVQSVAAGRLKTTASATDDCDDAVATKFTNRTCYYDGDGDGYRTTANGTKCVGATCANSSDNYKLASTAAVDCNDADANKYVIKNVCSNCNCVCKQKLTSYTCSGCSTATYACKTYCYDVNGTNCYCRYCPKTVCETCCANTCTN